MNTILYCKWVQVHHPVHSCTPGVGQWREAGQLPSPRMTLRGAKVGEILHVTGGRDQDGLIDQVRVQVQVLVLVQILVQGLVVPLEICYPLTSTTFVIFFGFQQFSTFC